MIILTFLLISLGYVVDAANLIEIQYFRKPVEYGKFRLSLDDGAKEWQSFIYMNKTVNLREEVIYQHIKPFFEGEPSEKRYESASITRHLGQQFDYALKRYPIDQLVFENLCSQMKPKFSLIIGSTTQKPKKIKWVVEHPSAAFTIPDGFRKDMGRDEYELVIGGRALLNQENFEFDALVNTNRLIVRQSKDYKNGVSSEKLIQLQGSHVYIEGQNYATIEDLKQFGKQWSQGKREVQQWEVHLEDENQKENLYFERGDTTLDISIGNGRLFAATYKTPTNRGEKLRFYEEIRAVLAGHAEEEKIKGVIDRVSREAKAETTMKAYESTNSKRISWLRENKIKEDELGLMVYAAHESERLGSAALAKISAEFQWSNNELSNQGRNFLSDLIKAKRKTEGQTRKQPTQVEWEGIEKIVKAVEDNQRSERDALIALLSWSALLRASEAASLQWSDLRNHENMLEVHIPQAKNDQLAKGRSTFVPHEQGSEADVLLCRWRARVSHKSSYVFPNLNTWEALSPSAISQITKSTLRKAGIEDASHHSLRRGSANALLAQGLSEDEIMRRGRWRSKEGLRRYLTDSPMNQGFANSSNRAITTGTGELPDSDTSPQINQIKEPLEGVRRSKRRSSQKNRQVTMTEQY